MQHPLAGQPNTNQARNKQLPETSLEGSQRMGMSLWKMCLDVNTLPDLLEPGMRKNTYMGLGKVGYVPLPREHSPRTPYKRPCDQTTREHPPLTHTETMDQRDATRSMVVTISCNSIPAACKVSFFPVFSSLCCCCFLMSAFE